MVSDERPRKTFVEGWPFMIGLLKGIADYVRLPLRFDSGNVIIDWLDEWCIKDYK